jgi:DNA-binding beta-propeller fold protein YncE
VWVANSAANTVTELTATTGALVKVISASGYGFNHPVAVSSDRAHVWVTNRDGQSVTVFPT